MNLFFFLFRVRPKCSGECRPPDEKIPQRSWLLENNIDEKYLIYGEKEIHTNMKKKLTT